jgi:hypothetical protein
MRIEANGGDWQGSYDYYYLETTPEGRYLYGLVNQGDTTKLGDNYDVIYEPSDRKFYDIGNSPPGKWGEDDTATNLETFPTNPNMQTQYWYDDNGLLRFSFDNPYYVAPPAPDPVERLVFTGGDWNGIYDYYHIENTSEDRFMYSLVDKGTTNTVSGDNFSVGYDPIDGKFYDIGALDPYKWGVDANATNISIFPTAGNMDTHYWYNSDGNLKCQFTNPYYVAPPTYVYEYIATEYNKYVTIRELDPTDDVGDFISYENSSNSFETTPSGTANDMNDGKYHGSPLGTGGSVYWDMGSGTHTTPFLVLTLTLPSPISKLIIHGYIESELPTTSYFKLNFKLKLPQRVRRLLKGIK